MPAAITCLVISGCQVACSPISKKVALRHSSASALSTAGVLPGQGPSSKVKTTSLSRRKSYCLKCSKPKPGPPVVSISTMRAKPMPPGLSQAGMAEAAGAGFGCAETFGAKLGAFAALFCASWLTGLTGKRREAVDAVCDPAVADETEAVVCEPADTFSAEMMPKAARASIIRSAAILMTMRPDAVEINSCQPPPNARPRSNGVDHRL